MSVRLDHRLPSAVAADPWLRTRGVRIRAFIVTLALLNLPFLLNGLLLFDRSPLVLIVVALVYVFLPLYYVLYRAGRGVEATYVCLALLALAVSVIMYNSTSGVGFMLAGNVLYVVLVVAAAAVLASPRALAVTAVLALIGYSAIVAAELLLDPATTVSGQPAPRPAAAFVVAMNMYIGILGAWLVLRDYVLTLRRLTSSSHQAQVAAEEQAAALASLAEQLKASNGSLLEAQARLNETVDALTLPLIPLAEGVLLLPVVGYLDGERGQRLRAQLLQGVHSQRASTLILDLTGLRAVDTTVAALLLEVVRATRLLGARVILSGVSAAIARALVDLNLSRDELETAAGLREALDLAASPAPERAERS